MSSTAAEVMIDSLIDWGVEVIFGLPGDGINGLMEALRNRQDKIRFVQVRHEEAAAFAACGYAKFTGRLGVCLATSGPGGLHLLNGLYDAKLDGQPVLAITGLQYHDLVGTYTQQDVELDRAFADVAIYNARVMGPSHVENVTDLACRAALGRRGVAHVTFPVDTQSMPMTRKFASRRNVPGHTSDAAASGTRVPLEADLTKAASILNRGRRVAIMAGRGALNAGEELVQVAELLAAPIIKPLLGKACVPDFSPYTTGGIGLLGTLPSEQALKECDTLLMVGTSFPYIEFFPEPGEARGVQIDSDPMRIGLRYPVEVGLVGDAKTSLQALLPLLRRKSDRRFLETSQERMAQWWKLMEERGTRTDMPMKPQVVAHELGRRLPDRSIVACDSGTVTVWWARHVPAKRGQMHSVSGNLASMGCGLPYAIAAQIAYPDRPCVAFVGDGGFSMVMAEFATCVKYKLPVKVIVLKNNTLGQIKWEQMAFLGNPEFGCDLQPIDFAAVARACGGVGLSVDDPAKCGDALDELMSTPGPALLETVVDPYEPPMPPRIHFEQAKGFASSLARGEKDAAQIISTVVKDKIRELI